MTTYKIVQDEKEVQRFIDWLPKLKPHETFYGSLFARKKYCDRLIKSNDKTQLRRWTTSKERILQRLYELEVKEGNYFLRGRQQVPQEALVAYIAPNPRHRTKAAFASIEKMLSMIQTNNQGWCPHAETMSCIQRTKSYNYVVDFDFDVEDNLEAIPKIIDIVGKDALTFIKTRGGFHALIKTKLIKDQSRKWYIDIANLEGADRDILLSKKALEVYTDVDGVDQVEGADCMLPIPGTYQGGFMPHFIDI